ncbi:wax ester/triacylglycerol synthase domain-containing protein [Rhodococcus sp. NPDC058532]|uniref:wax ester/triacylglycerol synthase domain-containing protein n=1 Tax=Rhodococcus sp. NPDC058532 TaxID=3346540 RepID=UPI003649B922
MGRITEGIGKVSIPLAPRDAANVYGESDRGPATIVDVYVFDGVTREVTGDSVADWIAGRLTCSPILTARLHRMFGELDYPAWITDEDFDVRDHVTVVPGDTEWGSAKWIIAGRVNARMDLTRPPWDITVLPNVSGIGGGFPDTATVVVLRFHHSVGDAVATAAIARRLFDGSRTSAVAMQPVPRPTGAAAAVLRVPARLVRFGGALVTGARAARAVDLAAARGELVKPQGRWPRTRFNRRLAGVPGVAVQFFDLADLAAIRSTVAGATVNDVMLTVIGGAMGAYLDEAGEKPGRSLAAKMPIATDDDTDTANKFALGSVDLHTDVPDATERLRKVAATTRAEKDRQNHAAVAAQRTVSERIPAFVTRFVGARAAAGATPPEVVSTGNTLISNVPSRAAGATFEGKRIIGSFGVLTLSDGDGLAHFVSSVGDRVSLSVTVDSAAMPDLGRYEDLLTAEFDKLATAASPRS